MIDVNKENYTFDDLIKIVDVLRSENGCSWDRAQTHESLLKYLIEESYEYIEATKQKKPKKQADELGDVLLQVILNAKIGSESKDFDINDVLNAICKKMIYRHPHVFSDTEVKNVDEILANWEMLKKKENNEFSEKNILKSISKANPALIRAQKVIEKIKKHEKIKKFPSFDKESIDKFYKLLDNNGELSANINKSEIIGQALLKLIYIASEENISVEISLNNEIDKIIDSF